MRNLSIASAGPMITRLSMAVTLLCISPSRLPAQAGTNQDIRSLRYEVTELKRRLVELEAKLAAFPPAAPPAGDERLVTAPLTGNAIVEPQPPSGVPVVA